MVGLSFLLLLVSTASYVRIRDMKIFFLVLAFFIFLVKGILLLINVAQQSIGLVILDMLVIIFLYLTVAKR